MKRSVKTSLIFFISAACIFWGLQTFAQPPGMTMAQVNQQTGRWVANQQMQFMQRMMNMPHVNATEIEYDFDVVMRDSTKKQVTSALYLDSVTKKHFIVWVDKKFKRSDTNRYKRIFPSQTRSLTCVLIARTDDDPGRYYPAVISDSCWMFKTLSGSINVYTYDSCNAMGNFDEGAIVGIQSKDGAILPYTEANLKAMVGQDDKALALISEKKYLKAIKRYNNDTKKAE